MTLASKSTLLIPEHHDVSITRNHENFYAVTNVRDRFMKPSERWSAMFPEAPSCEYWAMQLGSYSSEQLLAHMNALSLFLHLDREQSLQEAWDI